jgi:hypothetical protein
VVVHPDGAVAGRPAEVAAELARLAASPGNGALDREAVRAIRGFLADARDRVAPPGSGRESSPAGRRTEAPATAPVVALPSREPAQPDRQEPAARPAA